jgi:hypothetical protein
MRTILRRVGRLEDRYGCDTTKPALRLLVSFPWKGPINWKSSRCSRTRDSGGGLTEVIHLEGDSAGVSPDELERFIAGFPIKTRTAI